MENTALLRLNHLFEVLKKSLKSAQVQLEKTVLTAPVPGFVVYKMVSVQGEMRKVQVGDSVLLEMTQIGKECHDRCAIYEQAGDCVMPREGVFATVLEGGPVKTGDAVKILAPIAEQGDQ